MGDEVGLFPQFFQFGFDGEPGFRQQVADMRQVVDLLGDGDFEFFDACTCGGRGFEDTDDVGIFLLQACAVNVERVLVGFVANDQDRRLVTKGLNNFKPILDTVFFLS